jgi:hypothetical protein
MEDNMDKFLTLVFGASWRSSLGGYIIWLINYFGNMEGSWPTNKSEWVSFVTATVVAFTLRFVKDSSVSTEQQKLGITIKTSTGLN